MSRRPRGPRRAVDGVIKSRTNAWSGKRFWLLRLVCGHTVYTRNNSCQRAPKTAACADCALPAGGGE